MFQKSLFDDYLSRYIEELASRPNPDLKLWQECHSNFIEHWDLEKLDFKSMYSNSFKSTISTKLWKGNDYHPREVMLEFIDYDKEIVRSLFRDLLDESREIGGRMERFVFYCDQLLKEIQSKGSKFYGHYHDSFFFVSVYLTFVYPELYAFYDYKVFSSAMGKLNSRDIPSFHDFERYFKVISIFKKFIAEDRVLLELSGSNPMLQNIKGVFLAFDMMRFISKH